MAETEGVRIEDNSPQARRRRPPVKARRESFSEAEKRAARSERIIVTDALPYGWTAYSESQEGESYRLFREPGTKLLVCSCGDFIFRGGGEPGFNCKHVLATLRYIGSQYLQTEYDPRAQYLRT